MAGKAGGAGQPALPHSRVGLFSSPLDHGPLPLACAAARWPSILQVGTGRGRGRVLHGSAAELPALMRAVRW